FRQVEFDIYYGKGVCQASELIDLGLTHGIVKKSGSWYSIDEERVGQGRENARDYLIEHPELMARQRVYVLEKEGVLTPAPPTRAAATRANDEGSTQAAAAAKKGGPPAAGHTAGAAGSCAEVREVQGAQGGERAGRGERGSKRPLRCVLCSSASSGKKWTFR